MECELVLFVIPDCTVSWVLKQACMQPLLILGVKLFLVVLLVHTCQVHAYVFRAEEVQRNTKTLPYCDTLNHIMWCDLRYGFLFHWAYFNTPSPSILVHITKWKLSKNIKLYKLCINNYRLTKCCKKLIVHPLIWCIWFTVSTIMCNFLALVQMCKFQT